MLSQEIPAKRATVFKKDNFQTGFRFFNKLRNYAGKGWFILAPFFTPDLSLNCTSCQKNAGDSPPLRLPQLQFQGCELPAAIPEKDMYEMPLHNGGSSKKIRPYPPKKIKIRAPSLPSLPHPITGDDIRYRHLCTADISDIQQ